MTYLVAADVPTETAGERFRALVERGGIVQIPGAHNGMAALQAKAAGFEAVYLSGAAMTASMGLPDLGMITVDEVCFFIRQVARTSVDRVYGGGKGTRSPSFADTIDGSRASMRFAFLRRRSPKR